MLKLKLAYANEIARVERVELHFMQSTYMLPLDVTCVHVKN